MGNKYSEFQSTHPRGVRLKQITGLAEAFNFNPRTHVGCDLVGDDMRVCVRDFNPRTHVGCDPASRTAPV